MQGPKNSEDCPYTAGHLQESIYNKFNLLLPLQNVVFPEVEYWCPPISITVKECRAFGRFVVVGTHIISNISKFIFRPQDKSKTFAGNVYSTAQQ